MRETNPNFRNLEGHPLEWGADLAEERARRANGRGSESITDTAQQLRATLVDEPHTDRGHARRITALYASKLAWVPEWRAWAHFDGQRWRKPADEAALALAQSVSDVMLDLRGEVPNREVFTKAAAKLQCVKDAKRALEAAKPMLLVGAEEFDAKPHLLNTPGGTLDLETLELRPHDPSDRLTLTTAAKYDPDAKLDLWIRVIETALPDPAVRSYVQKLFGITLAGHIQLDILLLLYGRTRTSKGTVQGALHKALGGYACTAGLEDFALRDQATSGPRPELARLAGVRMVSIYETSRSLRLEASILKSLAGNDPITARAMYSSPVTFQPECTIWIASNSRPGLPADDSAVWERVREIPFNVQIPEAKRDRTVRARLGDPEEAGPTVLSWAVEGLRRYLDDGLETPTTVTVATGSYRSEMDVLTEFAEDCLIFGDPTIYRATPQQIRGALDQWRTRAAVDSVSTSELREWLRSRGCAYQQSRTDGRRRYWVGVSIVHHTEDDGS